MGELMAGSDRLGVLMIAWMWQSTDLGVATSEVSILVELWSRIDLGLNDFDRWCCGSGLLEAVEQWCRSDVAGVYGGTGINC